MSICALAHSVFVTSNVPGLIDLLQIRCWAHELSAALSKAIGVVAKSRKNFLPKFSAREVQNSTVHYQVQKECQKCANIDT